MLGGLISAQNSNSLTSDFEPEVAIWLKLRMHSEKSLK